MKKKCQVVMLPIDNADKAIIQKQSVGKLLLEYSNKFFTQEYLKSIYAKSFHLYIVSDDEIKEGDWFIGCVNGITKPYKHKLVGGFLPILYPKDKKIIATTDISLTYHNKTPVGENLNGLHKQLPQIPDWFINNYCANNGIDEVNVKYELMYDNTIITTLILVNNYPFINWNDEEIQVNWEDINTLLKVTQQNEVVLEEIVLEEIEEKLYTRDEVTSLLIKLTEEVYGDKAGILGYEDWIEENL